MTTFAATGTLARDLRATVRGAVIAPRDPGYATIDRIVDLAGPDSGTALGFVELRHLGGALGRDPQQPACATSAPRSRRPLRTDAR